MNAIGIDIGKRQHVAAVCRDGSREAEKKILRFNADRTGLEELLAWVERHGAVSRVVMESSGHYWLPLAGALHRIGLPVAVINPLQAKYFGKRRLQRTKSDPADARTLAVLGMRDEPETREPLAGAEVREAARFAMTLVAEQARVCNRIHRLIDLGFPELARVYHDPTCASALAVLREAPTAQQATRRRPTTLARARTTGGRVVGAKKATEIHALATATIAPPELASQVGFEMRLLIAQYDLLEQHITEAEARVAGLLDSDVARRLRTIPGVGPAIAATLIAEIGDIRRFSDFDKLVAYVGVHPAERSSGTKGQDPETSWVMAKTGNAYLRAALYRMAVVGLQHNPVIKAHYARKRAEGKTKMNALGHCMKKALSLVWGIWRGGHDFAPEPPKPLTTRYGT